MVQDNTAGRCCAEGRIVGPTLSSYQRLSTYGVPVLEKLSVVVEWVWWPVRSATEHLMALDGASLGSSGYSFRHWW